MKCLPGWGNLWRRAWRVESASHRRNPSESQVSPCSVYLSVWTGWLPTGNGKRQFHRDGRHPPPGGGVKSTSRARSTPMAMMYRMLRITPAYPRIRPSLRVPLPSSIPSAEDRRFARCPHTTQAIPGSRPKPARQLKRMEVIPNPTEAALSDIPENGFADGFNGGGASGVCLSVTLDRYNATRALSTSKSMVIHSTATG